MVIIQRLLAAQCTDKGQLIVQPYNRTFMPSSLDSGDGAKELKNQKKGKRAVGCYFLHRHSIMNSEQLHFHAVAVTALDLSKARDGERQG